MNYAAILSIFFFSGGGTFMNAAVQTMIEAWPQLSVTSVRMVTSLPCLVSLPVAILTGRLAGKRISYRFCAILGTALMLVGGAAPYFFHRSWTLILVFRTLLGIGVGFTGMRNALILGSVPEDKKSAMIGYGSSAMNACAMLAGLVVGILAGISWKAPFLFNLLAAAALLLVTFYLKEPEKDHTAEINMAEGNETEIKETENSGATVKTAEKPGKNPEGWKILVYIVLQFVLTTALYPVLSGMSTYMAARNIGSSFTAGISTFVYGLFGVLINLILNRLIQTFRQYMLPVMCLCFSAGMALVLFVPALPAVLAGMALVLFVPALPAVLAGVALVLFVPALPAVLAGVALISSGFNTLMSLFQVYNGKVSTPAQVGLTSTIIIAVLNLGNFASVYYINACHMIFSRASDIESTYFGSMLLYAAVAVLALIVKPAPKDEYKRQ